MKNTHGEVLLLVTKVTFFHGCFSRFLNCTNGTKLHKTLDKHSRIQSKSDCVHWGHGSEDILKNGDEHVKKVDWPIHCWGVILHLVKRHLSH